MNDRIRVLLVDDQALIRTGFGLVLSAEPGIVVVGEAGSGDEALTWLADHGNADRHTADQLRQNEGEGCDVVLMDVRMPGLNGIEATRAIAERHPRVRVLVLTTFDLDEYALAAVQAGAAGFLLKDARPTELVDAIGRVHAGDAVMAPSTTKRMVERIAAGLPSVPETPGAASGPSVTATSSGGVGAEATFAELTEREFEVFRLIADGLNNTEIGERLFLSESTIKTHVGRIFAKLHLRDRVHAVLLAKENGL